MKKRSSVAGAMALVLLAASNGASAYTECTSRILRVWTDAITGDLWVFMESGVVLWLAASSNNNVKTIFAAATAVLSADRTATVRFMADEVSCTSGVRTDMWGLFQNAP